MAAASNLVDAFFEITNQWDGIFSQKRIAKKIKRHVLGAILTMGQGCISRILCTLHLEQLDWSAEYRLFSRSPWNVQDCFKPVVQAAVKDYSGPSTQPIVVAGDITHIRHVGKSIAYTQTMRDPIGPTPYHPNLIKGIHYLHLGVMAYPVGYDKLPTTLGDVLPAPRFLPAAFSPAPTLKKPGCKATAKEIEEYKTNKKARVTMKKTREDLQRVRSICDQAGFKERRIHAIFDGSFCNKTIMKEPLEGVDITCRSRKNASLRFAHPKPKGNQFYEAGSISPEEIRQDHEKYPWQEGKIRFGNEVISIRYKEVVGVYWPNGAGRRPLTLLLVAEPPHTNDKEERKKKHPCFGRGTSYLLTTITQDVQNRACHIIQQAFDRWQIELAHREIKTTFKTGQAMVRNIRSVERHPALMVASYSSLHLAGLKTFGWKRTEAFPALPKWRKEATRPSCQDLITLFRRQILENDASDTFYSEYNLSHKRTIEAAAA